ncbi:MAG: flavin reductase family protein [Betaproteobacteria bacterium]|nr:MAG: flavin reductase family protein [Betaproteobacteria bacterium]
MTTISLTPADFTHDELYFVLRDAIIPRPIAWVSSIDAQGNTNLAPYSFFNVCSANPPILGIGCGPRNENRSTGHFELKDTLANIKATGEFVINIVPESMAEAMVRSSDPLPPGESEFAHAGLSPIASSIVKPPRVAGVPLAYECKLHSVTVFGMSSWVMGEVVAIHIDERVYVGEKRGFKHRVDVLKHEELRPYARLGGAYYARLREIETLVRTDGGERGT